MWPGRCFPEHDQICQLQSSKIHEIKETWTGQSELQSANYTLRTLPKGLKFFCPVSPSESPKVMGIHHPNALHHFNGVTHCPWCGREGQNEGTVINHSDNPLQVRAGMQKMLLLSLSIIWGHLAPWPQKLSANPRRGPWWIVFVYLTIPQCWHQQVPWGSPMGHKQEMHCMHKVCQTNISNQRHINDCGPEWRIGWRIRHLSSWHIRDTPKRRARHLSNQHIGDTPTLLTSSLVGASTKVTSNCKTLHQ